MAKARLENYNGYPAIMIDGKPYPPMTATVVSRSRDGRAVVDADYYKKLGESGIRIFYVYCDTEWLYADAKETFAYEANIIIENIPDAFIIPRISLHPSAKWMLDNPDEVVSYSDGKSVITNFISETYNNTLCGMYSLCSDKWRKDAGKHLLDMLEFFDTLPYSDRIIGYFLAAGGTSEWYYINPIEDFETGAYADTSKAFSNEFARYLNKKYGEDAPPPTIPGIESRYFAEKFDYDMSQLRVMRAADGFPPLPKASGNIGSFLDVDKFGHTFDFYRAWHLGTANSIEYFSRLIKERNPNKLVGAFYGSWGWSELIFASNTGGVVSLLNSLYLDFLANPGVYENRQPGGFTGQRQMVDSFRLHNKMYIVEDDTRTHAENSYFAELVEMFSIEDSLNIIKRDFGRNICEDLQSWWFDQHIGGGRYKFPEIYSLFARQNEIAKMAYEMCRCKGNEIAFIYDEESVHIVSKQTSVETVEVFRNYEIARIGAGVDQYYHNDMSDPNMPDYKLYVFCNCFSLSDKERREIKLKLAKNHAVAVFIYAPGIINPDKSKKLSSDNISELLGFNCELDTGRTSPAFKVNTQKLLGCVENKIYGLFERNPKNNISYTQRHLERSYLCPAVFPRDDSVEVLARYCQNGEVAIAKKETEGYTSVFCGAKIVNAELIRAFAKMAGCHIYEEDENVTYISRNFITVHSSYGKKVTLKFPENKNVYELYEEKYYGRNTKEISFDMKFGETKMFKIE